MSPTTMWAVLRSNWNVCERRLLLWIAADPVTFVSNIVWWLCGSRMGTANCCNRRQPDVLGFGGDT